MKNINLQQPNNLNNILQKVLVTKALTGNFLIAYKILNNPDLGLYKLKIKYKFQMRKFNGEHACSMPNCEITSISTTI